MPIPSWPETLPLPSQSFGGKVERPVIETQMEGGVRRRKRWGGKQREYSAVWEFDATEKALFESFVDTQLKGGVLYFTIELPIDGELSLQTVRFRGGEYSETYQPVNFWKVAATLEIEIPQSVNDPDIEINAPGGAGAAEEFIITENTNLSSEHLNALLRVQGTTSESPITLTVPPATNPAGFLPFILQHEGAVGGSVIVTMQAAAPETASLPDSTLFFLQGEDQTYFMNDSSPNERNFEKVRNPYRGGHASRLGIICRRESTGSQRSHYLKLPSSKTPELNGGFYYSGHHYSLAQDYDGPIWLSSRIDGEPFNDSNSQITIFQGAPGYSPSTVDKLSVYIYNTTTPTLFVTGVPWGSWYFMEFYYDPDASEMGIAINGGAFTTAPVSEPMKIKDNAQNILIGGYTYSATGSTAGRQSCHRYISLYDRMLTPAERAWIYNAGEPRNPLDYTG